MSLASNLFSLCEPSQLCCKYKHCHYHCKLLELLEVSFRLMRCKYKYKHKYKYTYYHYYCQLLQLLEVSFLLRKAATVSTPICEISEVEFLTTETKYLNSHRKDHILKFSHSYQEGGVISIKTSTTLKTAETKFKVTFPNQQNAFLIRPYLVAHKIFSQFFNF